MEILIVALVLKIFIPIAIFYIIMRLWYRSTAQRSNFTEANLSFSDWYHVVFDKENFGSDQDTATEVYEIEGDQLLVSELPYKHREMCSLLGLGKYLSSSLLKKHYRKKVFHYHPDRVPQNDPEKVRAATQMLIRIKESYDSLRESYFNNS